MQYFETNSWSINYERQKTESFSKDMYETKENHIIGIVKRESFIAILKTQSRSCRVAKICGRMLAFVEDDIKGLNLAHEKTL